MYVCMYEWYEEATRSRAGWRSLCRCGLELHAETQASISAGVAVLEVVCEVCGRVFRREGDKKRHKCVTERRKPVSEQRGAAQCSVCNKWFRSRGGLALHNCQPQATVTPSPQSAGGASTQVVCTVCHREFRSESGRKRHKCVGERSKPVSQQKGAAQCRTCQKWFRSKGGLARHVCRPSLPG